MDSRTADWPRLKQIFDRALTLPADARGAYVRQACGDDELLRHQIELLLDSHDRANTFLESPAAVLFEQPTELEGRRIGSYAVQSRVGAGGMGEVFRALDTRLNRLVAIKFLSRDLVDESARRRFQQEAKMASALNHPHIVMVHEAGELEGRQFLVTEFVDGGTLKEWARKEQRSWRQKVELLVGVADALSAAHEAGILHRDIKPANILVTKSGYAKLADFGLAKLDERAAQGLPQTVTLERTQSGVVIGTIAYMSPEQASGRPLDARSDIFAFGIVLYELLADRRPFAARTDLETLQAIVHNVPEPLGEDIPLPLRMVVDKALEKDPSDRYQTMRDLVVDLRRAVRRPEGMSSRSTAIMPAELPASRPEVNRALWHRSSLVSVAAAFALGAVLAVLAVRVTREPRRAAPAVSSHFVLPLAAEERLAGLDFPAVAISPDSTLLAYVAVTGGQTRLMLRPMNSVEATALPGTTNAVAPFFSPDSRWLGFFADGELKKIATAGGQPVTLCAAPVGLGGSWAADNSIVFAAATGSGLSQVSANGGDPRRVTNLAQDRGEFSHRCPEALPDGQTVLFTAGALGNWDDAEIVAQSLATGSRTVVIQGGTHPHYLPSGHLVYARAGTIMAASFDMQTLKLTGTPTAVWKMSLNRRMARHNWRFRGRAVRSMRRVSSSRGGAS